LICTGGQHAAKNVFEENEALPNVLMPVSPVVLPVEFGVAMRDSSGIEFFVEAPVAVDRRVVRTAVKPESASTRSVSQECPHHGNMSKAHRKRL
jgi:hypothetical protein